MGLFSHHEAEEAHKKVYGSEFPHDQVSHEVLAGAAGFEAMRMYEQSRQNQGDDEKHQLAKEALAGVAAAEVEKLFERGIYDHLDREKAKKAAQEQATQLYSQQYGQAPQ